MITSSQLFVKKRPKKKDHKLKSKQTILFLVIPWESRKVASLLGLGKFLCPDPTWSLAMPSRGTNLPTLPPLIATGYVQKIMCPAFWCMGVFPQQHAPGMVPPWVWLHFFALPKNTWLTSPTRNLAMNPSPDIFQNYHRPVCFSWKIHRCWCYSSIIPCADQTYMTHQSARKFSHGPLPHFWEPTPTWWQSWVVFTFACILCSLQLECPKRLCWQKTPHPIRSDHSGELSAQMNIAKMAYNYTALAICLVFHEHVQESFEQMIVGSFAAQNRGLMIAHESLPIRHYGTAEDLALAHVCSFRVS